MKFIKNPAAWALPFLFLAALAHANFGNYFILNSRISLPLDHAEKKISFRFTCRKDMNLTAASFYCEKIQRPPSYQLSLRGDEGGIPSQEPLGISRITPKAGSWNTASFSDLPLYAGKVYHLVIEYDANRGGSHPVGKIGPENFASVAFTSPLNPFHPRDEKPDKNSNVLEYQEGRWKVMNLQPLYALLASGLQSQGNPYDDFGERPIHGNGTPDDPSDDVIQGEALHPHGGINPKGFLIRVRKQGNPTSPLNFRVYSIDHLHHKTSLVYSGLALNPNQASENFQWVTIGLDPKSSLEAFPPECRCVVFQTNSGRSGTGSSACEDCYLLSDMGNSGGLASADYLSFDGGAHLSRAVTSNDGWKTWSDDFERDANVVILGNYSMIEPTPVPAIPTPLPWTNGMIP